MCRDLSFGVILPEDSKVRVLPGFTDECHAGIEELNSVKPEEYREAEWTKEDPTTIRVRFPFPSSVDEATQQQQQQQYRSVILATWPTREQLRAHLHTMRSSITSMVQILAQRVQQAAAEEASLAKHFAKQSAEQARIATPAGLMAEIRASASKRLKKKQKQKK